MKPSLLYRRLGDGGVLFNPHTWKTHILTPSAAIIYEALAEESEGRAIPTQRAVEFLQRELSVDTNSNEIRQLLTMLQRLRVIA